MIIREKKIIFIHIPKNAGTSIEEYFGGLKQAESKHSTIHDIKLSSPDEYKDYRKFAVVRNPYDRMVSWYFMMQREAPSEYEFKEGSDRSFKPSFTFKDYLRDPVGRSDQWADQMLDYCEENLISPIIKRGSTPGGREHLNDPQYTWVDESVAILKYENLKQEFNELLSLTIDLPKSNSSKHDHYLSYYDRESLDMVYEMYEEDFKQYNYKKL